MDAHFEPIDFGAPEAPDMMLDWAMLAGASEAQPAPILLARACGHSGAERNRRSD